MDNVLDVGVLLEDAENRGGMLDHVDDLQDHNTQVSPPIPINKNKGVQEQEEASVVVLNPFLCAVAECAA